MPYEVLDHICPWNLEANPKNRRRRGKMQSYIYVLYGEAQRLSNPVVLPPYLLQELINLLSSTLPTHNSPADRSQSISIL